ncbi:MAG: 3-phosphoshikimate 1-carboxyvinyltransferase [Oscillospiraceae bacterium]|jgi:3-phosphoshikimate 1-carboxyvinyltransferase|nr:3-phosphoshikimate 1-carboxyvinyltransferase [Oscillospiraceae bacterium]
MTRVLSPAAARGCVAAVPSKSDAHRLLIVSALAGAPGEVPAANEDIRATADCLRALLGPGEPRAADCGESGSTLRFLLPVAAALGLEVTFTGGGRLPERPLEPLLSLLRARGCALSAERLPLRISGRLRAGEYILAGGVSSQYITGLLFALPLLAGESRICLTSPLESAGYVQMTLRTLARFGIEIAAVRDGWAVPGGQTYRIPDAVPAPEGCWSSAAALLAAGALAGEVTVAGLDPFSAQPDRAVLDLLRAMGAGADGCTVRQARLRGITMDAADCPDLVPVMAAVMALAEGESRIVGAGRLRLKESDRLRAMAENLTILGADVTELPDGLAIRGRETLRGGAVDSRNDHRIAMAMAVAALRCEGPVTLVGAETVRKSYPAFWEDYSQLLTSKYLKN